MHFERHGRLCNDSDIQYMHIFHIHVKNSCTSIVPEGIYKIHCTRKCVCVYMQVYTEFWADPDQVGYSYEHCMGDLGVSSLLIRHYVMSPLLGRRAAFRPMRSLSIRCITY